MKTFAALIAFSAVASVSGAQATFHGDNARTGVYPGAGPATLAGVKWAFKSEGPIVTSPSIAGEVIYIASLSGHLHAIDRESGALSDLSRHPVGKAPCWVEIVELP